MAGHAPLVSVILPTHNRSGLLVRAIRSVLGQTYANLELIVVDDASTDDTADVVQSFGDARLRYLRLDRNSRAAAARNVGIRAARGELLAFQDDDDEWLPQKLERQVAAMAKAPADVGLILCSFRRVDESGESRFGSHAWERNLDFALCPSYNDFSLISTPNWLLKREVLTRAGLFDERLKSLDDWELALRIFDVCRYVHLDEDLWIQHRSRPQNAGMVQNERLILNDYPVLVEKHGARWSRETLWRYCFQIGRMHASLGEGAQSRPWLWRAIRSKPLRLRTWVLLAATFAGAGAMNLAIRFGRRLVRVPMRLSRLRWNENA
jgi:glycosyltransferase involved in cell wall biosynthesis